MVANILEAVGGWIVALISSAGYTGVVIAMAIESACIPLPSEIIMPFAGYLVSTGRFTMAGAAVAGALGCLIGSILAYGIGYYGGRPLAVKYGRYVLLSQHDLDKADRWFARWGNGVIFFSRLLPIVRTFISFPAGIARMPFWRFCIYSFLGSLPWCWALAYIGKTMGENWTAIRHWFHKVDYVIGGLILLGLVLFIYRHVRGARGVEAAE
jgi:membrane protein DedA with SNARE-associated domain